MCALLIIIYASWTRWRIHHYIFAVYDAAPMQFEKFNNPLEEIFPNLSTSVDDIC